MQKGQEAVVAQFHIVQIVLSGINAKSTFHIKPYSQIIWTIICHLHVFARIVYFAYTT